MWRLLVGMLALVLVGACRDGDDVGTARTTQAPTSSTTSTTVALAPIEVGRVQRTVTMRDLEIGRGATLGVGLHPGSRMVLTAKTADALEVCPATTDTDIDLSGGSWPGDKFTTCLRFRNGRAVVPATPVDTYHVGFAVRAPGGAGRATVDELTLAYESVDGYFVVALPPVEEGERTAEIVVEPETANAVEVDAYASTRFDRTDELAVTVTQDGKKVAAHAATDTSHGVPYGPVVPGREVVIAADAARAFERPTFFVTWS